MDSLKKILLSGFVVLTFIVYSVQQRQEGTGVVIAPPKSTPSGQSAQSNSGQAVAPANNQKTAGYKDGSYVGDAADAYYGYIQVQAIIKGGKITDVQFLQHPHDQSTSVEINSQAMPYLKQEAIQAQSSRVDVVSGATDTSYAFVQSLASALAKAQ